MTIYVDPRINNSNELEQSLARLTRVPITLRPSRPSRLCETARVAHPAGRYSDSATACLFTVHTLAVSHFRVIYDIEVTRQTRM